MKRINQWNHFLTFEVNFSLLETIYPGLDGCFMRHHMLYFNSGYCTLGRHQCMPLLWFGLVIKSKCSLKSTKIYAWRLLIQRKLAGTSRFNLEDCLPLRTKKSFELLLKTAVYSLYVLSLRYHYYLEVEMSQLQAVDPGHGLVLQMLHMWKHTST